MNQHVLQGKWKQIRGGFKKQWGKLTDDDMQRIQGSLDQIAGIIEQRYGYTRDRAEHEIDHFLDAYQSQMKDYGKRAKSYGKRAKGYNEEVQAKMRSAVSDASDKVQSRLGKEKKTKRRPWLFIVGGIVLAVVIAYLFNQQQSTHHSLGTNGYREGDSHQ